MDEAAVECDWLVALWLLTQLETDIQMQPSEMSNMTNGHGSGRERGREVGKLSTAGQNKQQTVAQPGLVSLTKTQLKLAPRAPVSWV